MSPRSVKSLALAVRTALGLEMVFETIVDQARYRRIGLEYDVASVPAVTSVGTALGNVRLPTKRRASGTAVAGFDMYPYSIYEHELLL